MFSGEGPQYYDRAYRHNAPFAVPGPYQTVLSAEEEQEFRRWVSANGVPFDVSASVVDYDMRGYWKANRGATYGGGHFPDTYKTPYDTTFSNESRYATPDNPFVWHGDNLIDSRDGSLIFGSPAQVAPAKHYFIQHADGTTTPLPLMQTGPDQWETRDEVDLAPGDEVIQRLYT
jgi:hypothetical protein